MLGRPGLSCIRVRLNSPSVSTNCVDLLFSSYLRTGKLKKRPLSLMGDFPPFSWHLGTQELEGIVQQSKNIDKDGLLFKTRVFKTKREAWLASLSYNSTRAYRVAICIRSMPATI